MGDWIGRTLSKVEIERLVGRGGMAEVYLGRHTTLNRPVAVKVLQAHLSDDDSLLSRFKAEAQAVAAMRHPNIVQVFDFDVSDDRPFIVMELLEGPSLKDYLKGLRDGAFVLAPVSIARLIKGLAAALDYAHARGIVHRDIKPANIMLRRSSGTINPNAPLPIDVEPVLTDFGVARIANATTHTASGAIVGTPAYMSPEQVRGEGVDARSDIYALGIVLYEMLTGRLPFDADTQASILYRQVNDPPPPLTEDYESIQPVIDRALAKTQADRFQKAGDLATVFQASLGMVDDTGVTEPNLKPRPVSEDAETMAVSPSPTGAGKSTASSSPTVQTGAPAGVNPLWIVAGIGALGLVVAALALALALSVFGSGTADATTAQPTQADTGESTEPALSATGELVGHAQIVDSSVSLTLAGIVPPSDGFAYHAWLTDPEQEPLDLGPLEVTDGQVTFAFTDPEGRVLVTEYTGIAISLEPDPDDDPGVSGEIVYAGDADPDMLAGARRLHVFWGDVDFQTAVLTGLETQAGVFQSHVNNTINSVNSGSLDGMKTHAEHSINIIAGEGSPEFGDWTGDGQAQNPGDGVGLRTYLLIVHDVAQAIAEDDSAGAELQAQSEEIIGDIDAVLATLDQTLQMMQSATAADSVQEVQPLMPRFQEAQNIDVILAILQQAGALELSARIEIRSVTP